MIVYISGPMSGYVDYNRPAFNAAAAHLRAKGYKVVNPAEMDAADAAFMEGDIDDQPHSWFMRRDLKVLLDCTAIYLLPGWQHSKGAAIEKAVADACAIDELIEGDRELWRTFEGEPVIEDEHYQTCQPVQGDGKGNEWCEHGEQVATADTPEPNGPSVEEEQESKDDGEDFPRHVEEVDPDRSLAAHYPMSAAEQTLRRHDSYRAGDKFPNVAYVRDMTGKTPAELAEFAREQFIRGEN